MFLFFDLSYTPLLELHLPTAYIGETQNGFLSFYKKATPQVLESLTNWQLSSAEKGALALVNNLQTNVLYNKYAKKGETFEKLFQNPATKKYIQEQIEEQIHQLLLLIAEKELFLTINYSPKDDISKKRRFITNEILEPLLVFEKKEEGITYRLYIEENGQKRLPHQCQIELLNNTHTWITLNQKVVRIAHIKASHLKPFLNKEETFIPERNLQEYFDKFLQKILRNAQVEAIGFEIIEKTSLKNTEIELINDFFANQYKIVLHFDYDGYIFKSNQNKNVHSQLKIDENNRITIYKYKRNTEEETQMKQHLIDIDFSEESGVFSLQNTDPFAAYFHLLHHQQRLSEQGFTFRTFLVDGKEVNMSTSELIYSNTSTQNDWFDLSIEVKQGENSFHFKDLISNIKENNPIYTLHNGKIFIIPQEWFSKFSSIAKHSKQQGGKLQLAKNNYALLEAIPELKPQNIVEKVTYTPSPNLRATLRPYQVEGVEWLLQHYHNGVGACLADDMGLGKTLQTIALLVAIHDTLPLKENNFTDLFSATEPQKEALKVLVILPSSLLFNWYDETKRFAPHFKCTQYTGSSSERKTKVRRLTNYDVVFTSYPIVERDSKELEKLEFRYIILDESQRIKNKNSKTFKAINALKAEHRIALSGTPIENALSDLWAQMQFINPNQLGSYPFFYKHYEVEISKKKNLQALEELKTLVGKHILRRTKEQVLSDLPDIEEQLAYCPMSEAQAQWYEREKSKVRNQLLEASEPISEFNALQMLTKLRQISNHPILADAESTIPSGKYQEVISYMEALHTAQHKALIFSSFVKHLELFEAWCKTHKIKYSKLTGATATHERKSQVEAFQNQEDVSFFFISLKAGEVGLNLTKASYVLLLDPWWNPFSERQAIARAHRIGQENKVNVIRFVSKDSIEEKIIKLQENKTELFENVIDENHIVRDIISQMDSLLE